MCTLFCLVHIKYRSFEPIVCFDLYYNSNISDAISAMAFRLGMAVDVCMADMPMLVLMALTLMQGLSGFADGSNQRRVR